jgi:hypothetical protein
VNADDKVEFQEQWVSVVTDIEVLVDEETGKCSLALHKTPIRATVIVGQSDDTEDELE